MRNDVMYLIAREYAMDDNGIRRPVETERKVFCDVSSIGAKEFFDAGRNGINPQLRFVVFAHDYKDETIVKYNGERYSVYRTYRSHNDTIELYVERKGGTNG